MIYPEKTYTSNPFVDNILYYAKFFAINGTVKDEEEALANETKETLQAGDILIACVEGCATYEMFKSIPKEIIEKYVSVHSNLDLYVNDNDALRAHYDSYGLYERTELSNTIDRIAREVYMDHYDIMTDYINNSIPSTWLTDMLPLYDSCNNGTADYTDLFDIMPKHTRKRIIKQYLNNYDLSDLDNLAESLENFNAYVATRTDSQITTELEHISKAMRDVFKSHYDMVRERGYLRTDRDKWYVDYIDDANAYRLCQEGLATYTDLFDLISSSERGRLLDGAVGESASGNYAMDESLVNVQQYLDTLTDIARAEAIDAINEAFVTSYMNNYNLYLNNDIYNKCLTEDIDYFGLTAYMPKETLKVILNTQIKEYTNIEAFAQNKALFDGYLQTIPVEQKNEIKKSITKDMMSWYVSNHKEYNNYYRAFLGLPPIDKDGNVYEDTLTHSWDEKTKEFKEFGNRFLKDLPAGLYPAIHWKQNIYEFDAYDIGILNQYGILEEYVAACGYSTSDLRYRYLRYLGDNKLNIYECRRALNFQLIGLPAGDDPDARKRYVDAFTINRDYVIRTVYSDAHKFQSDYYNKFMIIFIIINTIMDMLSEITTMIIDREVFDSRCIKWIFESYGVPYYSEIPLKYLRAMLKNLNLLLKYKSSTRNMIDICNLFGFSDVRVFGYYLFKERCIDENTGEYLFDENNDIGYDLSVLWVRDINGETVSYTGIRYTPLLEYRHYDPDFYTKKIQVTDEHGTITTKTIINNDAPVYVRDTDANDFIPIKDTTYFSKIKADVRPAELKFVKVPIDEELTKYKNDPNYILSYDEITLNDEGNTWDGGLVHENLYQDLLDHEFNAVKTKYISVETVTDLQEQCFQVSYFYNMLFDNLYSEDALTLQIPSLKLDHNFRFMDVICYLFALMYFYNDLNDKIMYSPTQILYVKGYNFDEALDAMMNDPAAFTQEPDMADRENIFSVNDQIAAVGYDYRQVFENYRIKGFNLEADVDELEKWLNENYQLSLSDFIVDDSLTTFDQVITLKQFFTLNNSYYQKDIFQDNIAPLPYNQNIKSAYGAALYEKDFEVDYDDFIHGYVSENGYQMEVINNTNDIIYVMDYNKYIVLGDKTVHALYRKYTKDEYGNYNRDTIHYFCYDADTDMMKRAFDNNVFVVNQASEYIFATSKVYTKNAETGEYTEITDSRYFTTDANEPSRRCLNIGTYWILDPNGNWKLDPEQAYVLVTTGGVSEYIKYTDAYDHDNIVIAEDLWWVKHDDGHFVRFSDTDFYRTDYKRLTPIERQEYVYIKDEIYIESDTPTDESDTDPEGVTRYFRKLNDYYSENNWNYEEVLYIYDANSDTYISESELLSPSNCWFEMDNGIFDLVINHYAQYVDYDSPRDVQYILILQEDNDYSRNTFDSNGNYVLANNPDVRYIYNSDEDYITLLILGDTYADNNSMIVVFNKDIASETDNEVFSDVYNPEETDKVWDENDWFYSDPGFTDSDIGMNGENIWYYIKPGAPVNIPEDVEIEPVGSGFYMEQSAYIGDVPLEAGEKYYMAFDIETNFTGKLQIYNTADDSVASINDRIYEVVRREKQHITQVFISNGEPNPEIRFLVYDFENYPVHAGDYIIISNIRFIKAYSENFISQDIPSYAKLQELYRTNEAIYKYLLKLMAEETDFNTYNIYKTIYDALMVSKYNKEAFKIGDNKYAETYTEFLENRDAVLYSKLVRFKSLDKDTMHKEIADEIIEVTYAIDDCVDTYSYGFLYSYFPAVSANYIQQYITRIINWFKSWKVHLFGINTVYKISGYDNNEHIVKILEDEEYRNRYNSEKINVYIHDTVKVNPLDDTNISGERYLDIYDFTDGGNTDDRYLYESIDIDHDEMVDDNDEPIESSEPDTVTNNTPRYATPTLEKSDSYRVRDRVRLITRTDNSIEFHDPENEMHLIFNDDDIKPRVDDTNNLTITSPRIGFAVENTNVLAMSSTESEHQAFAHQVIGEINKLSSDYIEWRDILDE